MTYDIDPSGINVEMIPLGCRLQRTREAFDDAFTLLFTCDHDVIDGLRS